MSVSESVITRNGNHWMPSTGTDTAGTGSGHGNRAQTDKQTDRQEERELKK